MLVLKIIIFLLFLALLSAELQQRALAAGTGAYEMSQVTTLPVPQKPIRFHIPYTVRKRGGEVSLRFQVTKEGKVIQLSIVKFTDADMVEPIYNAYERATYLPGQKNGQPVDTWMVVTEKVQ